MVTNNKKFQLLKIDLQWELYDISKALAFDPTGIEAEILERSQIMILTDF